MNGIVWFCPEPETDSVPLCRDYLLNGGTVGAETAVTCVIVSATGLLLVGTKFKGLVFSNKPVHKQLTEALELYVSDPSKSCCLYLRALKSGYIEVGADFSTVGTAPWVKDGNRYLFSKLPVQPVSAANPFVPEPEPGTPTESVRARNKTPRA